MRFLCRAGYAKVAAEWRGRVAEQIGDLHIAATHIHSLPLFENSSRLTGSRFQALFMLLRDEIRH